MQLGFQKSIAYMWECKFVPITNVDEWNLFQYSWQMHCVKNQVDIIIYIQNNCYNAIKYFSSTLSDTI